LIETSARYRWQPLVEQVSHRNKLADTVAVSIRAAFQYPTSICAFFASCAVARWAFDLNRLRVCSLVFALLVAASSAKFPLPNQCRDPQSFFSLVSIR
jgi:hypothetical protein